MAEWLSWLTNLGAWDSLFAAFVSYSLLALAFLLLARNDGPGEAIARTYDNFGAGASGLVGWFASLLSFWRLSKYFPSSTSVPPAGLPTSAYILSFLAPAVTALFAGYLVQRIVLNTAASRQWTGRKGDWVGASLTFLGGAAVVPLLILVMAIFRL